MIDSDLADLYRIEVKALNQAVRRNIERFPVEFMFQLTDDEHNSLRSQFMTLEIKKSLRSQIVTSNQRGGRRYLPYAFTEQGVAMLSAVLRSETAVRISIQIINAFVAMRRFIASNARIFYRLDTVERKQLEHKLEADEKFKNSHDRFIIIGGNTVSNLKYIRQWYLYFEKSQQIVGQITQIPWGHNIVIITKIKNVDEAIFYVQKTIQNNWSWAVLTHHIESGLYASEGKAITNFQATLPDSQSDLARQTLKDPYNFDFLMLREKHDEKELEDALINIEEIEAELGGEDE